MTTGKNRATVALAAVVITVSSTSPASDEEQSLDEVAQVFVRVLNSIEFEFDCLIKVISIRQIPASIRSAGHYYAEFRASGIECREATETLQSRGKAEDIVFFRRDRPYTPDIPRKEPILDLIHEIDPPIGN